MHNAARFTPELKQRYDRALASAQAVLAGLPLRDCQLFELRLARHFPDLVEALAHVYGLHPRYEEVLQRLFQLMAGRYRRRPEDLKLLDIERDLAPDWFQREDMFGYVFYVERFAGTLPGVLEHLDYLDELGVNYVHLMNVLRPRAGENDGGYAIADYGDVDPELGSMSDFERVTGALRDRGISACVDLVVNHCADDHDWALRARAGEQRYRDYFYIFEDRTEPDAFERTLPEIFPDFAPGNFTYQPDMDAWVWTTFRHYQWDLDWSNPDVFLEMLDALLFLANKGVEVFRLDAVAFLWKRVGTDSQNQPEVHDLLQALRACSRVAAPAVALKAEAIVSPADLVHYFGTGRHFGKVSNIAYHNSLMVQFWSSLASRDTRLMVHTLQAFPRTPASIAWATYLRCHDDIGWAVTDEDAQAVGLSGPAHRAFLSAYYTGEFPGSHARGTEFQANPRTGDRRVSGTFASLVGLEAAASLAEGEERELAVAFAVERILLGHALICGFGGIPLLYMGDELGMTNDHGYTEVPEHRDDSRWIHRPAMDWPKAERRSQAGTVEARIFEGVVDLVRTRRRTPQMHSAYAATILDLAHARLFGIAREHPLGPLVQLYNFSEEPQRLATDVLLGYGLVQPFDQITQAYVDVSSGELELPPYGRAWLI